MTEVGTKIREVRKKKGLSQEELADISNVNLRTIQRIEKNESEPHGKTLKLICNALHINVEDILDYGKETDKNYLIIFHLSVIAFLAIPVGNIILPTILWMNKKNKIVGLKEIGPNLLNYQILWTIITTVFLISSVFSKILHSNYSAILFNLFIVLTISNVILPIIFAFRTSRGKNEKPYPTIIKLIK